MLYLNEKAKIIFEGKTNTEEIVSMFYLGDRNNIEKMNKFAEEQWEFYLLCLEKYNKN